MGIIVLLLIFLLGSAIFSLFRNSIKTSNTLPYAFILGSAVGVFSIYLVGIMTQGIFSGTVIWSVFSSVLLLIFKKRIFFKIKPLSFIFFISLLSAVFLFFEKNFSSLSNNFQIASNIYADLGVHVPIIRSFSLGNNLPFEVPFFGGSNLSYHFLFDFYTGVFEATGIRINHAYNLISALTLTSLFFIFIDAGRNILGRKSIGFIAFLLFIFPPDLSIVNVPMGGNVLKSIWTNNFYHFGSFLGPSTVGNFLYFNTYLNQRHLLFALTLSLALFIPLYNLLLNKNEKTKKIQLTVVGAIIGFLPFWNVPVFLILSTFIFLLLLLFRKKSRFYFLIFFPLFLISFPQLFLISVNSKNQILFNPGFIISNNLSVFNFLVFWVLNLGVAIAAIIGGFICSSGKVKKVFIALIPIFLFSNLFQLTKDIFDGHKFFNFWFMFMCLFSASFIFYLLNKNRYYKILAISIFSLSIISGIAEFMVIKNDVKTFIPDYLTNNFVKRARLIIPSGETVLTNGEIYDPYGLAGGKTYLGRVHSIYTYGGNPDRRIKISNEILSGINDKEAIKSLAQKSGLRYIIIYKDKNIKNLKQVRRDVIVRTFKKIYEDDFGIIYKIR